MSVIKGVFSECVYPLLVSTLSWTRSLDHLPEQKKQVAGEWSGEKEYEERNCLKSCWGLQRNVLRTTQVPAPRQSQTKSQRWMVLP